MIYIGVEKSIFIADKIIEDLVYNMAKFEGNSFTFAEIVTVMNGRTVGNKSVKELNQIQAIHEGWLEILEQVENEKFNLSIENFIKVNSIVSRVENKAI